jgi:hypothetical protein
MIQSIISSASAAAAATSSYPLASRIGARLVSPEVRTSHWNGSSGRAADRPAGRHATRDFIVRTISTSPQGQRPVNRIITCCLGGRDRPSRSGYRTELRDWWPVDFTGAIFHPVTLSFARRFLHHHHPEKGTNGALIRGSCNKV